MDVERLVLVPLFTLVLLYAATSATHSLRAVRAGGAVAVLTLAYEVLLIFFYFLTIVLFFRRSEARASAQDFLPRGLAYVGTFAPLLLLFLPPAQTGLVSLAASTTIMLCGLLFAIYSLRTLGKSFGITPQARTLVRNGPYRLIRHPLYVGEALTFFGAILYGFSWVRLVLFLACMSIQWYRTAQEETILQRTLPEYAAYRAETWRFVPGVV